jgi:hypothetical protein
MATLVRDGEALNVILSALGISEDHLHFDWNNPLKTRAVRLKAIITLITISRRISQNGRMVQFT